MSFLKKFSSLFFSRLWRRSVRTVVSLLSEIEFKRLKLVRCNEI